MSGFNVDAASLRRAMCRNIGNLGEGRGSQDEVPI